MSVEAQIIVNLLNVFFWYAEVWKDRERVRGRRRRKNINLEVKSVGRQHVTQEKNTNKQSKHTQIS